MDEYNFATDVTHRDDSDVIWTNQNKFNVLEFNLETIVNNQLTFGNIPPRPSYIRTNKFGIVFAGVNIKHEKLKNGKYIHAFLAFLGVIYDRDRVVVIFKSAHATNGYIYHYLSCEACLNAEKNNILFNLFAFLKNVFCIVMSK